MTIISISRQIGSLGDEIARLTAEKLGYQHIGKSQISEVLSKYGFSAADVAKYDEKKPSLLQNLSKQKNLYAHFIRTAIYELAAKENIVIVGRGAQVILKDIAGALKVRIIAPYQTRVKRLVENLGYDERDARWNIRQSDRDSSGYISTYFDADWDDGDLYDLVINTRTMTMKTSIEMITSAAASDECKISPQVPGTLMDLALTHKVKAVLMEVAGMEDVTLDVQEAAVNLSGTAMSAAKKAECEKVVSRVNGVTKVINQINVLPENVKIF